MKKLSLGKILAICWIYRIVGFAVFFCGFPFLDHGQTWMFGIMVALGIVLLIIGVFFESIYYCCPHCGSWIGIRFLPYGYCRCCGKELNVRPEDPDARKTIDRML